MGRKPGAPRSPERRRGRSQPGRLLTALELAARSTKARRVECATMCILFTAVLAIFTRLRAQRARLPHDLRLNNYLSPPVHHHFHIVHVVVDDLGWGDVGWRADSAGLADGVDTPVLDSLRTQGVTLRQFYTPKDCAPSRASTLTGRWPFRVGYYGNPGDDGGVPSEFEFLPQMLHRRFGFQCHHIGKWHLGFKKARWTPTHRGFLTSIGFYHWGEDYESHLFPPEYAVGRNQGCRGYDMVNATSALWEQSLLEAASSSSSSSSPSSSSSHGSTKGKFQGVGSDVQGVSSAQLYGQEALLRMAHHPMDLPLYLFLAPQHVHDPYGDGTENTLADRREKYKVLVREFDGLVGTVVGGLKKYGFWEHTLMLIHTDNGGEMVFSDACASAAAWAKVQASSSLSLSTTSSTADVNAGEREMSSSAEASIVEGTSERGARRALQGATARETTRGTAAAADEDEDGANRGLGGAAAPSGLGFRGGAASNGALRGGKFTLWQGGVRGVAMLAGGAIPEERRGHSFDGLIHVVDLWASFAFLSHALGQLHHHKHTHLPASAASSSSSSALSGERQQPLHGRRTGADAKSGSSSSSSSSDSNSDTTHDQPSAASTAAGAAADTAAGTGAQRAGAATSTSGTGLDRRVLVSSSAAAQEWAARGYAETSTSGADSVASLAAAVLPSDSKFLARWLALRPDRPGPGGVMAATAGLSSQSASSSSSSFSSSSSSQSGSSGGTSHSSSSGDSNGADSMAEESSSDASPSSSAPLVGAAGAFEALFHSINGGGSDFTHLNDLAFQRSGLLSYAHRRPVPRAGAGARKKNAVHSSSSSRGGGEDEEEVAGEEEEEEEESGGFFGDLEEGFGEVWGMSDWESAAFAASEVMADSAMDWLGYSVDQRDSHLAAILASPLERNEILLQPLNEHSNGSFCAPSLLNSPFKPSCASGLIVWPYKLLMGYPGDPRHLSWPASNRALSPEVAQTVSESTAWSDARRITIIAEAEASITKDGDQGEATTSGSQSDSSNTGSSRSRRTSKSSTTTTTTTSSENSAYDWRRTISGDPVCAYLDPSNPLDDSDGSDLLPGRRRNQGLRFRHPRSSAANNSEFSLREARREERALERGRRSYFRRRRGGGQGNGDSAGSSTSHEGRRLATTAGATPGGAPDGGPVRSKTSSFSSSSTSPSSFSTSAFEGHEKDAHRHLCSASQPCLFDLAQDPYELHDLLGGGNTRRDAFAGLLDQSGRPVASRYGATLSAMQQRLVAMSSQGPPPVSSSGDSDAFPAEACARVHATGTWLPWEE